MSVQLLALVVACTTTFSATPNKYVTIYDDPNIPNCVMSPQEPYPGGICEQVQEYVNFGNSNASTTCPTPPKKVAPPASEEDPPAEDVA